MEWEEYRQMRIATMPQHLNKTKTEIKCPECGEYIYRDNTIILTSHPAQYRYFCESCGWWETSY